MIIIYLLSPSVLIKTHRGTKRSGPHGGRVCSDDGDDDDDYDDDDDGDGDDDDDGAISGSRYTERGLVPARYVRQSQMCPQLDMSDKNDQKTQDMSDKARCVEQK